MCLYNFIRFHSFSERVSLSLTDIGDYFLIFEVQFKMHNLKIIRHTHIKSSSSGLVDDDDKHICIETI